MNVTTEALTIVLLLPPAVFGLAVALESWASHRRTLADARRRHPAGSGLRACPECGLSIIDEVTHSRYCMGASRG